MARKFTAEEMRRAANILEHGAFCTDAIAMLRQAAEVMEREKRYEYARVLSDGSISCTHFDEYSKGYYKFRREVGEWEEVEER